jgi:hypothetical protein
MLWGPEGILTYEKMRQNILGGWGWGGGISATVGVENLSY